MAYKTLDIIKTNDNEIIHVDLDDVLDIFDKTPKPGFYLVVFKDGEIMRGVKMRKTVYNKFIRIKAKRGQVDNKCV